MSTRREFLKHTGAAGFVMATSASAAHAAPDAATGATTPIKSINAAPTSGIRIKSVIRREDTVKRYAFSGDCWHMSWAKDDRQYVSLCDGFGLSRAPKGMYNSRLMTISGGAPTATFEDVPDYPLRITNTWENTTRYYPFGTLAIDGRIYQFLSTFNRRVIQEDGNGQPVRFNGAKLICSPDNGRTWCNQNTRSPVIWESWNQRSRDTMVFFEEDQEAFSMLSVLQMGKNYELNRDGYVYVYAPNGNTEGTMNELVMFRVSKAKLLDRGSYEYFAGMTKDGKARWSRDIASRSAVHTFPRGWVNKTDHPYAWLPSVVYNAGLGQYMMTSWGMGCTPDGLWFGKPSYLGFWVGQNPWGPWTQVYEEAAWTPANDREARAFQPQIAPGWIAADGKSFWLVWSDFQMKDQEGYKSKFAEFKEKRAKNQLADEDWMKRAASLRELLPFYTFNTQRVDLVVA